MMEKNAQLGMSSVVSGYSADGTGMPQQDVSYAKDKKDEEVVLEFGDDSPQDEDIVFILPTVPGALDDSDIVVEPEAEIEVQDDDPKDVVVEDSGPKDEWDWQSKGVEHFLPWLHERMHNLPSHSGKDESGIERICSIFEALLKETSKAMKIDVKGKIDSSKVEDARNELYLGLDRLYDRLAKIQKTKAPKKKKKADVEGGLVKEAGNTPIRGISITVPLFISAVVRTMINSTISAGHSMDATFSHFDKKYKFTPRERLEIIQLLGDMNYGGMSNTLDRGLVDQDVDPTSSNNFDIPATFPG